MYERCRFQLVSVSFENFNFSVSFKLRFVWSIYGYDNIDYEYDYVFWFR